MLRTLFFAGIFLIVLSILLVLVLGVLLGEFYKIRTLASILFSLGLSLAISSSKTTANLEKGTEAIFRFIAFVTIFIVTFFVLESI